MTERPGQVRHRAPANPRHRSGVHPGAERTYLLPSSPSDRLRISSLVSVTPITHAILPLVLGRRWIPIIEQTRAPSWRLSGVVAFCGVLPDLLNPHLALDARHAAFSHSLAAWAIFSVCLAALCRHPRFTPHRATAALCAGAYALHLACDFITGGVPLFIPAIPGVWGDAYLPFSVWFVLDGLMLAYAYIVYRWLPLRRRIVRPNPR